MSAKWPTSVATDADLYTSVNSLQTTLATAVNNSVTSIVLASATGFPTAGGVTIDNEVIFYTGISGATLTGCTRGADGTTAASHSVGVPVGASIIAFHHNGLMAEIEAIETDINARFGRGASSNAIVVPSGVSFDVQSQMKGKGTATNDDAAAGYIGEAVRSSVTAASAVNSTGTGNWDNITSISLTAGDWDVTGQIGFALSTGTGLTRCIGAVSINSGGTTTDQVTGDNQTEAAPPDANGNRFAVVGAYRLSLSGTTTVYLKARFSFSGGTPQSYGRISARRVR